MSNQSSSNYPFSGFAISPSLYPKFLNWNRAPLPTDSYPAGTRIQDNSVNPPVIYETTGGGIWGVTGTAGVASLNGLTGALTVVEQTPTGTSGAIAITVPGSGGASSVGFGTKFDGTTILANGSDQLSVANVIFMTGTTPTIEPYSVNSAQVITLPTNSAYYVEADIVGQSTANAAVVGGKQQCVVYNVAGTATLAGMQNQFLDENPAAPTGQQDFQFSVSGATVFLTFFGNATNPMNYKARVNYVTIP